VCANYAAGHNIEVEAVVRVVFWLLQTAFILLYETGVSLLQLRVLALLWASSFLKACSMEANPFETMAVVAFAFWPVFDHLDCTMQTNTEQRAKAIKLVAKDEVLPISTREKTQVQGGPSVVASLTSSAFMCYLLYRRHSLTPDLFHFVTCLDEDLQHMLWLLFLWFCFRQPSSP
jgi:hypothetical protein